MSWENGIRERSDIVDWLKVLGVILAVIMIMESIVITFALSATSKKCDKDIEDDAQKEYLDKWYNEHYGNKK